MTPTRRLFTFSLLSLVTATAIAGCQAPPPLPTPATLAPAAAQGLARLALRSEWPRQVQAAGGYTRADIHHVVLALVHVDGSLETPMSTLEVPAAKLDTEIVFEGLAQNAAYRVKAYAYQAAGSAESDLISAKDDRSITEITIPASATTTIATLKLRLADRLQPHGYVTTLPLGGSDVMDALGLAVDHDGNAYTSDWINDRILKVTPDGETTTYTAAPFGLLDLAFGPDGTLYGLGADSFLYKLPPGGGAFERIATISNRNQAIAVDHGGQIYVVAGQQILKVATDGSVSPFAGHATETGTQNGTGSAARFSYPSGIGVDASNNLYVTDSGSGAIRRLSPAGEVTTCATGFVSPTDVAAGTDGTLYVTENQMYRVRKVAPDGAVSLVAGGTYGHRDGFGTGAKFSHPTSLALDAQGRLLVMDSGIPTIRKIY